MNLLPCAHPCRHQKDGYCTMEGTQPIQQINGDCPYFVDARDALPSAKKQLDRLRKAIHADQFDFWFKS